MHRSVACNWDNSDQTETIKEYILTAVENDAVDNIFDPAHGKYWRMFNELETRQLKRSLKRCLVLFPARILLNLQPRYLMYKHIELLKKDVFIHVRHLRHFEF